MSIFLLRSLFEILRSVYGRILKLKFKPEPKLQHVAELSSKSVLSLTCAYYNSAWTGTHDLNSSKQISCRK